MDFSLDRSGAAHGALRPYASRDVAQFSDQELAAAVKAAAHFARLAQVPSAVLAAEVQRRDQRAKSARMARKQGHRNANEMVANAAGGTRRQARDLITAGGLFDEGSGADGEETTGGGGDDAAGAGGAGGSAKGQPHRPRYPYVREAFVDGRLSSAKATRLIDTLDQLTGDADKVAKVERLLVAKAVHLSLADLEKVCLHIVAKWDQAAWAEREKRIHAERYLNVRESADGTVNLSGRLDAASAAPVIAYLDAQVKAGFQARRDAGLGPALPGEAGRLRIDALVTLARHGMRCDQPGSGVSTTIVVRLDEQALRTGLGLGSCDSLAVPLTAGAVRRMAVDAQILPVVLGTGSQALDVGYATRFFTLAQRLALAERDGGCAYCHAPVAWCDAHHIDWWKRDKGPTDLANGVLLCVACHHRIHDDGWQVRATATEVWFIPPASVDPERRPRRGGKSALEVPLPEQPPSPVPVPV